MSNPCTASTCLNGNCLGCKNGVQNCFDSRCYPNCPNCNTSTTSNTNWIIITIILVLSGVLLIMAFIIGYDWFIKDGKAKEPKNLTINKHIHNIRPASIVSPPPQSVSPPQSIESITTPYISENIPINNTLNNCNTSNTSSISTEGINLSLEGLPIKNNNSLSMNSKIEGFE